MGVPVRVRVGVGRAVRVDCGVRVGRGVRVGGGVGVGNAVLAQVFLRDDRFSDPSLGLNGTDYDPAGYLLVAQFGALKIYKVPLDAPAKMTEVKLSQPLNGDGMMIASDGTLYAVAYPYYEPQAIFAVTSHDDWVTANVIARVNVDSESATTLALRDGVPYFINSYLNSLTVNQYQIVRAAVRL